VLINDGVAQPRADPHDDVIARLAADVREAYIVDLDRALDRDLVAPATPVEVCKPPQPLVRQLRPCEAFDAVAIILRPRLLHGAKQLLSLGVHNLRCERVVVLGRLACRKLDALLAAPTAPTREGVQPAEHGLGGAQVLGDVEAGAWGRAGRALRAHRGGDDQHGHEEHEENEAASSDRQEDRKVPTKPAPAKSATAAAEAAAAKTTAAAPTASQGVCSLS
jgi:hypothetical protein